MHMLAQLPEPLYGLVKLARGGTLTLMLFWATAVVADDVGPITAEPTSQYHPGKVVWVDLVTHDVRRAADFYRQVFGWSVRLSSDSGYAEATYRGRPVAAFARYDADAPDGEAQWLVSISVPDVAAAAQAVRAQGGQVLEGPEKLPDRGRFALVSDVRGARFMVLQAAGGDPPDEPAQFNEWLWPELWTDQPAAAIEFYEAVLGYRSVAVREKDGSELTVLGRDGMARATLVKSPWPEVKPNWLLYLAVEDIGETVQNIERNGGEVLVPATLSSDGDVAIVADPTGGVFALQERRQR